MNTIISTKPYACEYSKFETNYETHSRTRVWQCTINGGSGVMLGKGHIFTPDGVATEIDDEGLEILMSLPEFRADIKAGFIKVIKDVAAKKVDADEEANKDMNLEHMAKPMTEKDFKESGAKIDSSDGSIDITGDSESTESVAKKAIRRRGKRS